MGGLYAYFMGYLEPTMFQLTESIYMFAAIVIGGIGSVFGSILGSAFVISIPQIFVFMREYTPLILSILIIVVMIFEPLGLYGVWLRIKLYFMNFPFR
jgi:ABC-type branched-chain amino acid transport system, permease component